MSNKGIIWLFLSAFIIINGCAPTFSEFQSADLVGEGNMAFTPYMSSTSSDVKNDSDGEDEDIALSDDFQESKGILFAYGLNEKFDIHLKYESVEADVGFVDGTVMGAGIKYQFHNNGKHRFSGLLPISQISQTVTFADISLDGDGGSMSETNKYTTIEPTLLGSSNVFKNIDLNYSAKMIVKVSGDDTEEDSGYALNFSSSIPVPKLDYLKVIPEYGIFKTGDHTFNHSGIGLAFRLNM